jgi:hypothetical protein
VSTAPRNIPSRSFIPDISPYQAFRMPRGKAAFGAPMHLDFAPCTTTALRLPVVLHRKRDTGNRLLRRPGRTIRCEGVTAWADVLSSELTAASGVAS